MACSTVLAAPVIILRSPSRLRATSKPQRAPRHLELARSNPRVAPPHRPTAHLQTPHSEEDPMRSTTLPPPKIRDVKVILTAPNGIRLVVVNVLTS